LPKTLVQNTLYAQDVFGTDLALRTIRYSNAGEVSCIAAVG